MRGQGTPPLPIVPSPALDERLSSWLSRTADLYLVSPGELCAHVGLASDALPGLDLEPGDGAIAVLSWATGFTVAKLVSLTYRDIPALARSLVNLESLDFCPTCATRAGTRRAGAIQSGAVRRYGVVIFAGCCRWRRLGFGRGLSSRRPSRR